MSLLWKDGAEEVLRVLAIRSGEPGPFLLALRPEVERRVRSEGREIVYGMDVALVAREWTTEGSKP